MSPGGATMADGGAGAATLGVVIPCYRQERFLPRTLAALERALAGVAYHGVLVRSAPGAEPLPPLPANWEVIAPPVSRPLTPGAARMLGFAAAGGEWVLFVDADVEIEPAWVERALATARDAARRGDATLAGLWGRIEEWMMVGTATRPGSPDLYSVGVSEHPVEYLATLSFYKRSALLAAGGYDARLNSEEDFELGLRFKRLGLTLVSLPLLAARHWSGPRPSFAELSRRWSTGLCLGQGQVLRLYLGRPGFGALLRRQVLHVAALGLWGLGLLALALSIALASPRPFAWWLALPLGVVALMTLRKKSARLGLHSLLAWTVNGLGILVGFFAVRPPLEAQTHSGEGA